MQRNVTDPYSFAIKQGNLPLAQFLARPANFDKHPDLLKYVLTEATYSDAIKKEILLFIGRIDPISIFKFVKILNLYEFQKFIELGVDVNLELEGLSFMQMILTSDQFLERAKLLISKGAPLHHMVKVRGFGTFLHILLANEDFQDVSTILNYIKTYGRKMDFHLRDGEGKTLLLLAAKVMAYTPVKRILEEDPSCLEIPDNEGRTPLHIACALGNCAIVELLIKAGANLNARDSLGNTPAYYAATNIETVKTILSSISIDPERDMLADCNAIHVSVKTPFYLSNREAQVLNLRSTSAPANFCNGTDDVNILSCVENKRIFERLDYFGMSLVMMEYTQQFMRNFCGKTIAQKCMSGHLAVMKILIQHQADISLQNDAGVTPRQSARNTDIVACLEEAEPIARFHRLQTWCLSFANSTRPVERPIQSMEADEPTEDWRFYQDAPGLRL